MVILTWLPGWERSLGQVHPSFSAAGHTLRTQETSGTWRQLDEEVFRPLTWNHLSGWAAALEVI